MGRNDRPHICRDCVFWIEHDYCGWKPLFTHTEWNARCDETDIIGREYYRAREKE